MRRLKGKLFTFNGAEVGIFLEDVVTDEDDIWITDVLIGDTKTRAIFNWHRVMNKKANKDRCPEWVDEPIQLYLPEYRFDEGYDDVRLV